MTTAVLAGVLAFLPAARSWLEERRREDALDVRVTVGVFAASSSPVGGRVDYYVLVDNTGPLPVAVDAVAIGDGRVAARSRRPARGPAPPGGTAYLPLSVRLDCTAPAGPLTVSVTARPASGRPRAVAAPLQARPLTDLGARLCAVNPTLRSGELSGPVLGPG